MDKERRKSSELLTVFREFFRTTNRLSSQELCEVLMCELKVKGRTAKKYIPIRKGKASLLRMHKETIRRPSHDRSFRGSCCSSKMSKWKAQACGGVGESEGSVGRLGGLRLAKENSVRGGKVGAVPEGVGCALRAAWFYRGVY